MSDIDDGLDEDLFRDLEQFEKKETGEDVFDALDDSPDTYDVPHATWRPSQYSALKSVQETFDGGNKFAVMELPTGTGKSSIATALGRDAPVLVLVHTLSLLDQYADKYGFSVVKGTQEYLCVLPKKVEGWRQKNRIPMASDCDFSKWSDCPVYEQCPYIIARNIAMKSRRMGCTYRYAAVSALIAKRPGIVVLDEAHSAAEEILQMEEIKITEYDRQKFNLPYFPFSSDYGKDGKGDVLRPATKKVFLDWIAKCAAKCSSLEKDGSDENFDPDFQQEVRSMQHKLTRIVDVIGEIEWFMEAGPSAIETYYKGRTMFVPGIRLRPLSAKGIAKRLWKYKDNALLMSATIGDPAPLARELGMDEYVFKTYPHPTPVASRPVFDLGMQRMTWNNTYHNPELFRVQAQKITKFINRWPAEWRGIILTSSYEKIRNLRKYLGTAIGQRLANHGEASDMKEWLGARRKGEIAIQTMQGWGHGIDLYGDLARFMVMASVPFKNPEDRYEQVRQSVYGNPDYFWWSCYVTVPQSTGRVSRGEQDENGNWMLNVAALADGSSTIQPARRFYPAWFLEAIVPLK